MNGIADMGGMQGFGPVDRSDDAGPFHHEWERRILGITFSALGAGLFNVDEIRRVTEDVDPITYLKSVYYERWLYSTEALLREKGVISARELADGRSASPGPNTAPPVTQDVARVILEQGGTSRSADGAPARFRPGDAVDCPQYKSAWSYAVAALRPRQARDRRRRPGDFRSPRQ